MAIGPQRGSGGNAEPRALFLHPPPPPPFPRRTAAATAPRCIGILFRSFSRHRSPRPPLRHAPPAPPPAPDFLAPSRSHHAPSPRRVFFPFFFCPSGEKMRAARRLVEGTDDVVSDVPPPGTLGGGDARMRDDGERARGRVRAPPPRTGGCIYRGGVLLWIPNGGRGEGGRRGEGPSLELDGNIITSREAFARLNARVQPAAPRSCVGLSPLRPPPLPPRLGNRRIPEGWRPAARDLREGGGGLIVVAVLG